MSELESTDLVCRARRESLSEEEQRRLEQLLRTSLEVQLTRAALRALDGESRVRRGDEALIGRIAARGALRVGPVRGRRWLAPRVLLAALSVLLVGAGAGAWWAFPDRGTAPGGVAPLPPPSDAVTLGVAARSMARGSTDNPPELRSSAEELASPSADTLSSSGRSQPAKSAPAALADRSLRSPAQAQANTPDELFARANLHRRDGQEGEARRLYRAVVEGFPSAREAAPARLALAKLEERNAPQQALAHYRSLATNGGRLRAEALWGMAESARRLGQTDVEQQALSELVREFPDSPYGEVARRRRQDASR